MDVIARGGAEGEIAECRKSQAEAHESPRITAIGNGAHQELAETISERCHGTNVSDHLPRVTQRVVQLDGHDRRIIPNEVVESIAEKRGFECPPTIRRI